jgi:membrane-associated protease RseP (regulator of RpoE activity)
LNGPLFTIAAARERPGLIHWALFACTLLTTLFAGTELLPRFAEASVSEHFSAIAANPWILLQGAPFSLSLLFILGVHEIGHFSRARRLGVDATWPYFLPGPPYLSVGTFGAFIRLKGAIPDRGSLMEIGALGPVAGFAASVAMMVAGYAALALGYRVPTDLGANVNLPLGYWLLNGFFLGRWEHTAIFFENPLLAASWIGFFVQGLNLLPAGQLDGGHVLYAFARRRHLLVSRALGLLLFALVPWGLHFGLWAVLLLVLGYGHPSCVWEERPPQPRQAALGVAALVIFILSFHPLPFAWTG